MDTGGTVPAQTSSSSSAIPPAVADDVVSANVASRMAMAEERRLALLAEAREARMAWVLCDDDDDDGHDYDDREYDGDDAANDANDDDDLLSGLRACRLDVLPCAPLVIDAMLMARRGGPSSAASIGRRRRRGRGDETTDVDDDGAVTSLRNLTVKRALDDRGLEWGRVSDIPRGGKDDALTTTMMKKKANKSLDADDVDDPILGTPSAGDYKSFLVAMCSPGAADVVLSCVKFCATMKEASNVVISSSGGGGDVVDEGGAIEGSVAASTVLLASISRAIRGFVSKTTRLIEEHEAFRDFRSSLSSSSRAHKDAGENCRTPASSFQEAAVAISRERLTAIVEKFVYGKCRRDIEAVLAVSSVGGGEGGSWAGHLSEDRPDSSVTVGEADAEFHERVRSLQFVTPAHLEIRCLARSAGGTGTGDPDMVTPAAQYVDVDLSRSARRIRSLHHGRSSPREILRSILLAHHGVSIALNESCGGGVGGVAPTPPGADDVLPALILATLRSRATRLISALRFVEVFALPSMLRGEAGYAYTSLCGAVQFLRDLDVDGHLKGVTLLGGAGERSAVLSIGPDDFRVGLEECRKKMMLEVMRVGELSSKDRSDDSRGESAVVTVDDDDTNDDPRVDGNKSLQIKITARQVRDARSRGEVVDLDWALKKQHEAMWKRGAVVDLISKPHTNQTKDTSAANLCHQSLFPGTINLPPQFSRSYSFLTIHPDNISIHDLPNLLNEYKMLVHVTELLLNEHLVWRENERKRLARVEREHLEREFVVVTGADGDGGGGVLANGH